jgi:hypothetical protein
LILCLPMATASHAAGLELRQTVWAMQVLALGTGGRGFERYRLFTTVWFWESKIPQSAGLLLCWPRSGWHSQ